MTGDWESWSYIWSLIPGFVGIGIIISGIIEGTFKEALSSGLILLLIGAILLFVFGFAFGLPDTITQYWPTLLMGLGLISLIRAIIAEIREKPELLNHKSWSEVPALIRIKPKRPAPSRHQSHEYELCADIQFNFGLKSLTPKSILEYLPQRADFILQKLR
jgi:hypothetical protein